MNFSIFINDNTGFYFYSTLIQSNAAIISLFGLFYIYKLQSIRSSIEELYASMLTSNLIDNGDAIKFRFSPLEKKKEIIGSYKKDNELLKKFTRYYIYENSITHIKSKMKLPTIAIIILISFEIVFLLLCTSIHKLGSAIELATFVVVLVFQIYILFLLGKTIIDVVEPD